jgi:VWA domain containing CoxE-like protein
MASLPVIATQLICFDTTILDLTDELADPVEVLFGVQLGGGTDINAALAYCETKISAPARTHLVLISDLYEGGDAAAMLARAAALVASGVNLIVLLALSDDGRPGYDANHAGKLAALGCPVFACTPGLFPDLMAAALRREDIAAWAAARDIALVRASG